MICLKEKKKKKKYAKEKLKEKSQKCFKNDCKRVFQEMWELQDVPRT